MSKDRRPSLIGICHVWLKNVRIIGYNAKANEHIPSGTSGDMEVLETDVDGRVIRANFHPGGAGSGYGAVLLPEWEYVGA